MAGEPMHWTENPAYRRGVIGIDVPKLLTTIGSVTASLTRTTLALSAGGRFLAPVTAGLIGDHRIPGFESQRPRGSLVIGPLDRHTRPQGDPLAFEGRDEGCGGFLVLLGKDVREGLERGHP